MRPALIFTVIFASCCVGCTHSQLRRSTLDQGKTISDLHMTQVLDNVALFLTNEAAMPHFNLSSSGSAQVSDSGSISPGFLWDPFGLVNESLGLQGGRSVTEQWSLVPILDPDRLYLMRCAFQWVTSSEYSHCDDCVARLKAFFGPTFDPECQLPVGWYCVGKRRDVPKHAPYVGRCGNTYVWVQPSGVDALTRLTLTIINISTAAPYSPPKHQVVTTYDGAGAVVKKEVTELVPDRTEVLPLGTNQPLTQGAGPVGPLSSPGDLPRTFDFTPRYIPLVPPSIQYVPSGPMQR